MMKVRSLLVLLVVFNMILLVGCNSQSNSQQSSAQNKDNSLEGGSLTGVIPWGAGGSADNISRAIGPLAEKHLGQSLVLTNRTGATGAVAMQSVLDQKPDGKTLLFAAENPALYGVLGISKKGFEDLYPVNILATTISTIVVSADSKYKTIDDLVKDASKRPGKVKMGSTGPGGQPFVVSTMLGNVTKTKYNLVPFDGDGPLITALLGGHIDATSVGLTAALENAKAGKIRVLAVVHNERIDDLKDAPAITESIPEMEKFLPWGPFYGVWVRNDTPDDIKQTLMKAFAEAQKEPGFQKFLDQTGAVSLGLSGEEAEKYWKDWQSTTAWVLQDAGVAKVNPEELNIKKKE